MSDDTTPADDGVDAAPAGPPDVSVAVRTTLEYAAWADELIDRLHRLREDTTDRHLRALLIDASDHASRAWMAARTLAGAVRELESYVAARRRP